jgi:hypothetical protein
MGEFMDNILKYLNENPGVGIVIAAVAVLITVIGWFIKKRQKSVYKNSPHITADGDISSGGNIVVGNSNVVETVSIPEFHLHLYGAGSKRKIEGHIEKKDGKTLVIESVEIDGSSTTLNRQFTRLLPLENLNHPDLLFTTEKQNIIARVVYRTLEGKRFEYLQEMSQEKRADNLFNVSLTGTPSIKRVNGEN